MTRSRRLSSVAARLGIALFCWMTALYAFVASSAFAYLQFLKPRVFAWVGLFGDWHAAMVWCWYALLLAVLAPDVRRGGAIGRTAAGLAVAAAAGGLWNTIRPVVPSLSDGDRSIAVGVVALLPVIWLAAVDHLAAAAWLRRQREAEPEADRRGLEGRVLIAALGTAVLVVAVYALLASMAIGRAFEPDLMAAGLTLAVGVALLDHWTIFAAVFLALAAAGRLAAGRFAGHYVLLGLGLSTVFAAAFVNLVGRSIGLSGGAAWVAGATAGLSIAATWGGLRVRRFAAADATLTSAIDVFVLPPGSRSTRDAAVGVAAIPLLAYLLVRAAGWIDWDFVLLESGVLVVWVVAFVAVAAAVPRQPRLGTRTIVVLCVLPLALHAWVRPAGAGDHALERYAVHNASFRLAHGLVRPQPAAPSFERFLRAHTGLTDVAVAPTSIDFVSPLPPSRRPRPLIFLFVIDSLRPDYLSPYNDAVRFTPRIQEFAARNLLFRNAFTRYGGTGLSMPAIWAGSSLVHKQYVLPFAPMNALEKLLDANGYRKIMSRDHITAALWRSAASDVELDRGRPEMEHDFCRTLDELGATLGPAAAGDAVFAQTRSLNLHVAAVRNGYVPPGKSYPGFEAPYAWRVERMDACFGGFIDRLKRLGLYDRSLVVLTADHGELIGEDGRWGHSYHLFPEVIQVPLIIHLPDSLKTFRVDPGAMALSTDITPTIYAALGYRPRPTSDLMGRPLVGEPDDEGEVEGGDRGDRTVVLAASYGAVYAVLKRNGRRLYLADAIKGGDRAYERRADGRWMEVPVDAGTRAIGELHIRRHVDALARLYGLDRRF